MRKSLLGKRGAYDLRLSFQFVAHDIAARAFIDKTKREFEDLLKASLAKLNAEVEMITPVKPPEDFEYGYYPSETGGGS